MRGLVRPSPMPSHVGGPALASKPQGLEPGTHEQSNAQSRRLWVVYRCGWQGAGGECGGREMM